MGACHFGHWVFLTLCLVAIFPGLQAGTICCSPRKFSATGEVTAYYPASRAFFRRVLVRHYDADDEKLAETLKKGDQVEYSLVQTHGKVFYEMLGKCRKKNQPFHPECLPDYFYEASPGGDGGSGAGGSGEGGSGEAGSGEAGSGEGEVKVYRSVYVHPSNLMKSITELHVDDNCLLQNKTIKILNARGGVLSLFKWDYTYDSVGSVNGSDPFVHCRPGKN